MSVSLLRMWRCARKGVRAEEVWARFAQQVLMTGGALGIVLDMKSSSMHHTEYAVLIKTTTHQLYKVQGCAGMYRDCWNLQMNCPDI